MVQKNSFILLVVVLFMVFVLLAVVDVHHDNRIMDNLFQVFPVISILLSISLCVLNDISYAESFTMSCIGYEFCALYLVLCVMGTISRVYSVFYFFEVTLFIEYIIRAGHVTLSLLVVRTMHSVFLLSSLRILLHVLRHWHLSPCRHSTASMRCPIVSYMDGLLESSSCSFKSTSVGVHFRFFGAVDYFESVKGKTILSLNGVAGFYKMKIYV